MDSWRLWFLGQEEHLLRERVFPPVSTLSVVARLWASLSHELFYANPVLAVDHAVQYK